MYRSPIFAPAPKVGALGEIGIPYFLYIADFCSCKIGILYFLYISKGDVK